MTRRCRIHCANLRGDGAIVCPSCWSKVPAHLKSEVAAAPRDTMAARIAARKVYEWLNQGTTDAGTTPAHEANSAQAS